MALITKCVLNTDGGDCVASRDSGSSVYSGTGQAEVGPQGTKVGLRSDSIPVPNYSNPLLYA